MSASSFQSFNIHVIIDLSGDTYVKILFGHVWFQIYSRRMIIFQTFVKQCALPEKMLLKKKRFSGVSEIKKVAKERPKNQLKEGGMITVEENDSETCG